MKRKKSPPKYPWALISVLVLVFLAVTLFKLSEYNKGGVVYLPKALMAEKDVVYPTQYSDNHITQNAISSDPRFKNLTFVDNKVLLSNVISSVSEYKGGQVSNKMENGTWLWTPLLNMTPSYVKSIIFGAKKNKIGVIYLSIDSYLDVFVMSNGSDREEAKQRFDKALQDFISQAHKNNIAVDVEAGWRNWAEEGNTYKPFVILQYAMQFNKTHSDKIRGIQYDVEPYLLESYQKDKSSALKNFVTLMDQTVSQMDGSDLALSVVIPEFYDEASGHTPEFSYKGKSGYTFGHLLSVLERREGSKIIVMAYRNFSKGEDSSVDVSKDEISEADGSHTKIIIAQETGDVLPPYITFHNTSRSYYKKQLSTLQQAFTADKSFGGIATHYINAFLELR